MVTFKRADSEKLSDNFGIDEATFNAVESVWEAAQDEMNQALKDGFSKPTGEYEGEQGVMFDATKLLDIFFKHFNTQELQDCALIQFLSMDIQKRAENHVRESAREAFEAMMKGVSERVQGEIIEGDDTDLEEIL